MRKPDRIFNRCCLLIDLYDNLYKLFGANTEQKITWMCSYNVHLKATPHTLITSTKGLKKVIAYLDLILRK